MASHFIAGEWASNVLRLSLCVRTIESFQIIDRAEGPGVMGCQDFEAAFFDAATPWLNAHGTMPILLAGMVGGNIGWHDTGYAACPAGSGDMHPLTFQARSFEISLIPGLRCINMFGQPDVVRGEELQMLGWLDSQDRQAEETHVLCLPGRHVKWVITRGAQVESFFTGMNGEMEDILLQHSLLGRGVIRNAPQSQPDFEAGVSLMFSDPSLSLGHALFATRSRLVLGDTQPETAASFLSGLLIGADIRDALAACDARGLLAGPVIVLGVSPLASTYAGIMNAHGHKAVQVTEPHLAIQGIYNLLSRSF